MKYCCATNSNLAYFIELTTALECQKQLLMSSISNLGGRESLEIAVTYNYMRAKSKLEVRIRSEACVCSEARVYSELCLNKFCPAYD